MSARVVGDGPVDLVWVHGMFLEPSMWEPVAQRLRSEARSTLVALRGHGAAPGVAPWTFEDWVDDVREVVAGCRTPPWVIGHSLGGWVGAALAREAPASIRGVLVVNHTLHLAPALRPGFEELVGVFAEQGIPAAVAEQFLGLWHAPERLDDALRAGEVARLGALAPGDASGCCAAALRAPDLREARFQVPVTFLLGGRDALTDPGDLPPHASVEVEPGWAHYPADPERLADRVRAWVRGFGPA